MYNKDILNILWDFDGTLAYRDGMWSSALFSLLNKNGINDIPIEKIRPYLQTGFSWHNSEYSHKEFFKGKTWNEYYNNYFYEIFLALGIEKDIAKRISKNVIIEYMDKTKWFIYDDVIKTLENIMEIGYKNYILSNHVPELNVIVRNIGLSNYFNGIYSSANIGYEKPNLNIYDYVLKELGIDKITCIIIGDSFNSDIRGGEKSGIKSILVRSKNTENYKWYCSNLENIIAMIEEIKIQ